jgi:hypothetical protein
LWYWFGKPYLKRKRCEYYCNSPPEAEGFLDINVALNNGKPIPFTRLPWSDRDDPGRFLHSRFINQMKQPGFICYQYKPKQTDFLTSPFQGRILLYSRE